MMAVLPDQWKATRFLPLQKIKRIAINAFLLFNILAITSWCIPLNSPLIANFRDLVRPYMVWSGLFQTWDMFAPSPRNINSYVEAVVIYKDGRTQTWRFPRMEKLGFPERDFKERYRKFAENVENNANSALWPDVARRIARLHENASNPPALVLLIRYWSEIKPPSAVAAYRPEPWRANIFFEYTVKPQDLS
jgi:hypothetical protein